MSSEMTVEHLDGWCLISKCAPCQQTSMVLVAALRRRGVHEDATITEAARRMRCDQCDLALEAVWLIEGPQDRAGYPPIRLVWPADGPSA
jgi:hypothetical protein